MIKYILIGVFIIAVAVSGYVYMTKPCFAGICFTGKCFSHSMCGSGCVCGKKNFEPSGYCFSID